MRNTKRSLRIVSVLLAAVLVALCGTAVYLNHLESTMPQGEAAQKVWKYAKENGLRYLDYPQSLIDLLPMSIGRTPMPTFAMTLTLAVAPSATFAVSATFATGRTFSSLTMSSPATFRRLIYTEKAVKPCTVP